MAGGVGSHIGSGGMITKIRAAKRAARSGAHTVIASGREPNVLLRLSDGEQIGTQLIAETMTLAARKQWLADHLQVRGRLTLDAGAVRALTPGRQEPAADWRPRPERRIRARRSGELSGLSGTRGCTRAGELQCSRDAKDSTHAQQ
jgi:hypothetical protein